VETSSKPCVWVIGGSGGIGAAICRDLANNGSLVSMTYHRSRPDALIRDLETAGSFGGATTLDVRDPNAVASACEEVFRTHGRLNAIVHAAGPHVPMRHLSQVTPSDFANQMSADAAGFFNVMVAALPKLRASRGSVVAVTTAATRRYPVRDGLSAAPKGAVEALVRGFAAEEGRYGVRVNAVAPGMLTDGMAERLISSGDLDERALDVTRANIPMRTFGSADDIAYATTFLLSERAAFISGQTLCIDGGYSV